MVREDGGSVRITSANHAVLFLLVFGKPINERAARRGPIVTNTEEELEMVFDENRNGLYQVAPFRKTEQKREM